MRRWIILVFAVLVGCSDGSPPSVDVSTPDRALKSYWAAQDFRRAQQAKLETKQLGLLNKVATDDVYRFHHRHTMAMPEGEKISGEIIEVKNDSDTRSVIVAKLRNVTPPPKDVQLTNSQQQIRDRGELFRYVMVREPDGWKVGEVWALAGPPIYQARKYYDSVSPQELVGTLVWP